MSDYFLKILYTSSENDSPGHRCVSFFNIHFYLQILFQLNADYLSYKPKSNPLNGTILWFFHFYVPQLDKIAFYLGDFVTKYQQESE